MKSTAPCFHLLRRLKESTRVGDLLHKLTGCLLQYLSDAAAGWRRENDFNERCHFAPFN